MARDHTEISDTVVLRDLRPRRKPFLERLVNNWSAIAVIAAAVTLGGAITGWLFERKVHAVSARVEVLTDDVDTLQLQNTQHTAVEGELLRDVEQLNVKVDWQTQTLLLIARDQGLRPAPTPTPLPSAHPTP